MADSPITPIPVAGTDAARPPGGETNPTILEAGAGESRGASVPELPAQIGHYKVVREIGTGGMGHVLKCLDTTLGRYVALKLLRPALARNAAFIERFKREAHAVAKLRHPNIVQIYAIGAEAGHDFFTMEYVDGEGLDRVRARRNKLPEREAAQICLEVCRGLQEAHEAGILHRDIKPGNVLVNSDGRAQLSDFGLAKFEFQQTVRRSVEAADAGVKSGDASETDPGRVMGTPFYMAPELIQGREADPRTDVYAVGVMLYELLAGRVPFKADDVDVIFDAHLNTLPPPIAELSPEVSLETARIVYRALEKDPQTRYQSAGQMADALQKSLDQERRSNELRAQAALSAEMAQAFGSMRIGSSATARNAKLLTWIILAMLALVPMYFVMQGLQMKPPSPIAGSRIGDLQLEPGSTIRVGGILDGVVASGEAIRLELATPTGTRWLELTAAGWEKRYGPELPAEDSWWCAEGTVRAPPAGVGEPVVVVGGGTIWKPDELELFQIVDDSNMAKAITTKKVKAPNSFMLDHRARVRGTVLVAHEQGAEGAITLLLRNDDYVCRVVVSAEARKARGELARLRTGEVILATGRMTAQDIPEDKDPLYWPNLEVQVIKGTEIGVLRHAKH